MNQFGLKQEHIDSICQCFAQHSTISQVILYGSRAKGNFKTGSDIDLTIIDTGITFSEFQNLENKLDDLLLPYKIDLSLKRQINNADLLNHIDRIGKLFYKKDASAVANESDSFLKG